MVPRGRAPLSKVLLMSSTPVAFPQVISRRFTYFRVCKFNISPAQSDFRDGFDSRQLHQNWPARAISPSQVSFPIYHTWPSQAAFTWGEVFIYYVDHPPLVEEFGEHA
jgi:hypothetical protein